MIVAHIMIVKLPVPLYDCNTSWAFMIVAHFTIVKLPVAPLWLWHSLRPFYDCGILLLSIKFDWWFVNWFDRIGETWYRWSNMLVSEYYLKYFKLPSPWPWPSNHVAAGGGGEREREREREREEVRMVLRKSLRQYLSSYHIIWT